PPSPAMPPSCGPRPSYRAARPRSARERDGSGCGRAAVGPQQPVHGARERAQAVAEVDEREGQREDRARAQAERRARGERGGEVGGEVRGEQGRECNDRRGPYEREERERRERGNERC